MIACQFLGEKHFSPYVAVIEYRFLMSAMNAICAFYPDKRDQHGDGETETERQRYIKRKRK